MILNATEAVYQWLLFLRGKNGGIVRNRGFSPWTSIPCVRVTTLTTLNTYYIISQKRPDSLTYTRDPFSPTNGGSLQHFNKHLHAFKTTRIDRRDDSKTHCVAKIGKNGYQDQ
jgi:hypothetical protein